MNNVVPFKPATTKENEVSLAQVRTAAWAKQVLALKVIDDESKAVAEEQLVKGRKLVKAAEALIGPFVKDAYALYKRWYDQQKRIKDTADPAIKHLSKECARYKEEQDRAAAERQRQQDAEILRLKAEAEESLREQARILESVGQKDLAEQLIAMPVDIPLAVTPTQEAKSDAVDYGKKYRAEIFDLPALLRALIDGKLPEDLAADAYARIEKALLPMVNPLARTQKELFSLPGVKAVVEMTVSVKR